MSTKNIHDIDWSKYSRQGLDSPDFLSLIQDLASPDELTRLKANAELFTQLEWAYEKANNELPFEIVPVLLELLQSEKFADKSVITDLLIFLASYSALQEPYKSKALRLKNRVCEGIAVYQSFFEDERYKPFMDDEATKEDMTFLIESCKEHIPKDAS